jgi:hypothetical protein
MDHRHTFELIPGTGWVYHGTREDLHGDGAAAMKTLWEEGISWREFRWIFPDGKVYAAAK